MMRAAVVCVIVEISVGPDDVAQLADDAEKVYAGIFETLPGFLYGSLGIRREECTAVAVVYFDSAEALRAADSVIEGVREAMGISPGATFTLVDYEVTARGVGPEAHKLFAPIGGAAASGRPL